MSWLHRANGTTAKVEPRYHKSAATLGELRQIIAPFDDDTKVVYIDWELGSLWTETEIAVGVTEDGETVLGFTTESALGFE